MLIEQLFLKLGLFSSRYGRGVARGGAEGAKAPPEFGRSVNPIQTMGGRLCPSHYCQSPRIKKAITTIYTSGTSYTANVFRPHLTSQFLWSIWYEKLYSLKKLQTLVYVSEVRFAFKARFLLDIVGSRRLVGSTDQAYSSGF